MTPDSRVFGRTLRRLSGTFTSLAGRNYKLYITGQAVSSIGTWMQKVGMAWLVLELGASGTLLGVTMALQELPTLVIGPWAGLIADRVNKRRLILYTHTCAGILALTLGLLIAGDLVELWMVMLFALAGGIVNAIDWPARQSFVREMVAPQHLTNAVSLNSVVTNVAKAIGPAIAGALIAGVGLAVCFFVNSASYFAVVLALALLRREDLMPATTVPRVRGQVREGLRYVRFEPVLAGTLLLMAVAGMLAYEWTVTLPLLALDSFDGDAQTVGFMFSAMGTGAVVGGLVIASGGQPDFRSLLAAGLAFSGLILVTAALPTLPLVFVTLALLGGASVAFRARAITLLQLRSVPEMRGRVMALLAMAVTGTTLFGAPLVGWIGENVGPRYALALGGVGTGIAVLVTSLYIRRQDVQPRTFHKPEQFPSGARPGSDTVSPA